MSSRSSNDQESYEGVVAESSAHKTSNRSNRSNGQLEGWREAGGRAHRSAPAVPEVLRTPMASESTAAQDFTAEADPHRRPPVSSTACDRGAGESKARIPSRTSPQYAAFTSASIPDTSPSRAELVPPANIRLPPRYGPAAKHRSSLPAPSHAAVAFSTKSSLPSLSINDIVNAHRPAMLHAETAIRAKARKEIGLSPRTPGFSLNIHRRVASIERARVDIPPRTASTPGAKVLEVTPRLSSRTDIEVDGIPPAVADDVTPSASKAIYRSALGIPKTPARSNIDSKELLTPRPTPSSVIRRTLSWSRGSRAQTSSPRPPPSPASDEPNSAHEIALYLRSPHLNRFIELLQPYPRSPLRVSLAEVGRTNGHPVLVFLGLGCVRHLTAIFEDLAWAYGLRLICIDRWGLGRTDQVEDDRRLPLEWARVVEHVLTELGIDKFGILAHSAGAVYGAAVALRLRDRVIGSLQLLAPWVGQGTEQTYKWLRWVPDGMIKGAVAAEHRLQSYLIGKPPPLQFRPVEYNLSHPDHDVPDEAEKKAVTLSLAPKRSPSVLRRTSVLFTSRPGSPRTSRPPQAAPATPRSAAQSATLLPTSPITPSSSTESAMLKSPITPVSSVDNLDVFDGFNLNDLKFALESAEKSPLYSASFARRSKSSSSSTSSLSSDAEETRPTRPKDPALVTALLQASHAECEPGTTSDLMAVILNRSNRLWGFSYTDVPHPMTVWWGTDDERISGKSIKFLEAATGCEVHELRGEGHNLMTSGAVLCEVFGAIRKERKAAERREDA